MTGIVKTDQIQGAQGTTVTVPTGNTLAVTSNATVGGTLGVTGNTTVGGTLGVTGTATLSGATSFASTTPVAASAGYNMIPEFISNLYLAGNSATSADLQNCFSSTYSVYRIIGILGGAWGSQANVYFQIYTGTNTIIGSNWYGAGRRLDDAQTEGNVALAANDVAIINTNQSSTGFGIVDMHLYTQPSGTVISGNTAMHDQSGDRGFYIFNFKNSSSSTVTGFKVQSSESGNMSAINLSVYGYRIRQNATSKMTGSYS